MMYHHTVEQQGHRREKLIYKQELLHNINQCHLCSHLVYGHSWSFEQGSQPLGGAWRSPIITTDFLWRKWQLWRVASLAFYTSEGPPFTKLCLPQAAPLHLQRFPNRILLMLHSVQLNLNLPNIFRNIQRAQIYSAHYTLWVHCSHWKNLIG